MQVIAYGISRNQAHNSPTSPYPWSQTPAAAAN